MSINFRILRLMILLPLLTWSISAQTVNAPHAQVLDDVKLPRVLIIGDSISIGYTVPVQKLLEGKAIVHHIQVNGEYTSFGLRHMKDWLGNGDWDVIVFNWGIWDTHMLDEDGRLVHAADEGKSDLSKLRIRTSIADYQKNLKMLIHAMANTHTRLIWATSTPCLARKGARFDDIARYNKAADEIMRSKHVAVVDLYSAILPNLGRMQLADGTHYSQEGYEYLGKYVAAAIISELTEENDVYPAAKQRVGRVN